MKTSIISKTKINTIDTAADYDNAPIKFGSKCTKIRHLRTLTTIMMRYLSRDFEVVKENGDKGHDLNRQKILDQYYKAN